VAVSWRALLVAVLVEGWNLEGMMAYDTAEN
jgi:hypothetical protein